MNALARLGDAAAALEALLAALDREGRVGGQVGPAEGSYLAEFGGGVRWVRLPDEVTGAAVAPAEVHLVAQRAAAWKLPPLKVKVAPAHPAETVADLKAGLAAALSTTRGGGEPMDFVLWSVLAARLWAEIPAARPLAELRADEALMAVERPGAGRRLCRVLHRHVRPWDGPHGMLEPSAVPGQHQQPRPAEREPCGLPGMLELPEKATSDQVWAAVHARLNLQADAALARGEPPSPEGVVGSCGGESYSLSVLTGRYVIGEGRPIGRSGGYTPPGAAKAAADAQQRAVEVVAAASLVEATGQAAATKQAVATTARKQHADGRAQADDDCNAAEAAGLADKEMRAGTLVKVPAMGVGSH